MLKNLLKTWETLAPAEVKYVADTLYLLNSIDEGIPCVGQGLLTYEQDALQGYIQRCIESRGWGWKLCKHFPRTSACIYLSESHLGGQHFIEDSAIEALLTAYLSALAAQRLINPGKWRHFKGGEIGEIKRVYSTNLSDQAIEIRVKAIANSQTNQDTEGNHEQ